MTLRFELSQGSALVILSAAALESFDRHRQLSSRSKEAGGQLFARFEGSDTVIVEATEPKWLDRRHRTTFEPNRWLQQREIRDRRKRGLHFVGDWHTHPEPIPKPSYEDLRSMKKCFDYSKHDLRNFILVVVGSKPAPTGLYVGLVGTRSVRLHLSVSDQRSV